MRDVTVLGPQEGMDTNRHELKRTDDPARRIVLLCGIDWCEDVLLKAWWEYHENSD